MILCEFFKCKPPSLNQVVGNNLKIVFLTLLLYVSIVSLKNAFFNPQKLIAQFCMKDKFAINIKIFTSFCANHIKIYKSFFASPEPACLRNPTGFTRLGTWAELFLVIKLFYHEGKTD